MHPYHGPDRNPRPARFRPPPNSCDCHAHIFGPKDRFPYPRPLPMDEPPDAGYEEYVKMHEVLGIDRGVLTNSGRYADSNDALLDALDRAGGTLRGIVSLATADITDKVIADLEPRGVRGIRVQPARFGELEEISRRIADAGWRVELVPKNVESMVALRPTFERMKCGILIDQMGRPQASWGVDDPAFQSVCAMVRDGLVWVKISHAYHVTSEGPPYADVLPFARALVDANIDRCVWGTDWPHPMQKWPMPNDGELLDLLADWVPDEAKRHRILVDNPQVLNRF